MCSRIDFEGELRELKELGRTNRIHRARKKELADGPQLEKLHHDDKPL